MVNPLENLTLNCDPYTRPARLQVDFYAEAVQPAHAAAAAAATAGGGGACSFHGGHNVGCNDRCYMLAYIGALPLCMMRVGALGVFGGGASGLLYSRSAQKQEEQCYYRACAT